MLGLWLGLVAFGTALLSGVFGMAGGIILMGVFTALLPVAAAMVLHGATQLFSNALRAVLLWRDIYWPSLRFYLMAALLTFAVLWRVRFVPDPWFVYLGIGAAPFVARLLPPRWLDFQGPLAAFVCGVQVTALNLTAGAAGPLLDVAFVETKLTKQQIVATKAISQVFSHLLKLAYFGPLLAGDEIPRAAWPAIALATLLGTFAGTRILKRLSDARFRLLSRYLVYGIGIAYLVKAATL